MVTIQKIGKVQNEKVLELVGLSSDEKPTKIIDGVEITNGSTFLEMDTQVVFMYDEQYHRWLGF